VLLKRKSVELKIHRARASAKSAVKTNQRESAPNTCGRLIFHMKSTLESMVEISVSFAGVDLVLLADWTGIMTI
jgi:hypothetical protein